MRGGVRELGGTGLPISGSWPGMVYRRRRTALALGGGRATRIAGVFELCSGRCRWRAEVLAVPMVVRLGIVHFVVERGTADRRVLRDTRFRHALQCIEPDRHIPLGLPRQTPAADTSHPAASRHHILRPRRTQTCLQAPWLARDALVVKAETHDG
jgi:hypothetical protein